MLSKTIRHVGNLGLASLLGTWYCKCFDLDHYGSDAPLDPGAISWESWKFSLHWSAVQTALMRTQIPSCCIDLQNRCIGLKSIMANPLTPGQFVEDLVRKNWMASDCWTLQRGKRPHYHSGSCAPHYFSVFLSPDSELLQGRSYTCFNSPS